MKKTLAALLTVAMTLSLTACGGGDGSSTKEPAGSDSGSSAAASTASAYADLEPVELIGADSTSMGAAGQLFGELVTEKVAEITGGQLTIDYHPNGDLGADVDLLRQVQSNDISFWIGQIAPAVSFVPEAAVFDLPMVFAQYDGSTIDKVLNGDSDFNAKLGEAFNYAGFQFMGVLQNATYRLTTANTELKTLADFNGLQIRTMENPNHMDFWTAIGAQPTPMAWNEVYFALQSGNIAAQENAADTCVGANLNEVQKYLACTNHILYANMMVMNQDAWNDLDPLYQEALQQAVTEALADLAPDLAEIDQKNKDTLVEKGMTLIEYEDSFYEEVLAVPGVQELYKSIDESCGGLGTVLQEALKNA